METMISITGLHYPSSALSHVYFHFCSHSIHQVLAAVIFACDKHFRFVDLGHRGFKGNITVDNIEESSPSMGLCCVVLV